MAILKTQQEVLEILRSQRDISESSTNTTKLTLTDGHSLGIPVRTMEEFDALNKLLKDENKQIEFVIISYILN